MENEAMKKQTKWTEEKIDLLKRDYPLGDKDKLAKKLEVTRDVLKDAARRFGVKSLKDKNFYKLAKLYEDTHLSYYWMGFIMADGHISQNNQLSINLSIKDLDHLILLSYLINSNVKIKSFKTALCGKPRDYCVLTCQDAKYGKLLKEKFGITDKPKTYFPPTLSFPNKELFLAFFIGFLDGDGTFSKDYKGDCSFIRLELHSNWLETLKLFSGHLKEIGVETKYGINSRGFSFLRFYRHKNFVNIKKFAIEKNLPILKRKWDCINIERISRNNKFTPNFGLIL